MSLEVKFFLTIVFLLLALGIVIYGTMNKPKKRK